MSWKKSVGFDSGCMDIHNTGGLKVYIWNSCGYIYRFWRVDMMRGLLEDVSYAAFEVNMMLMIAPMFTVLPKRSNKKP